MNILGLFKEFVFNEYFQLKFTFVHKCFPPQNKCRHSCKSRCVHINDLLINVQKVGTIFPQPKLKEVSSRF